MIKRYKMISDRELNCVCEIDECATGDYVLYSDYVKVLNAYKILDKVKDEKQNTITKLHNDKKLLQEEIDMLSGDITDYQYIIKKLRRS